MLERTTRWRSRASVAVALAIGLVHASLYRLPFEDAFITYRYAENLAHGRGLVYDPGERVEGFSSFAWTLLLAFTSKLGLPIVATSQLLSLACGLALLLAASRLVRALVPEAPAWLGGLAAALVALDGTFAYYAASGMEATAFALVVCLALGLAAKATARASVMAGLVLALGGMLRPEGVGYAALVVAALAIRREGRRDALRVGAAFAIAFVPYFAARWAYFGGPLPNTFYAKATPSSALLRAGVEAAEYYLTAHLGWIALAAAVLLATKLRPGRAATLVAFVALGACANVVVVGGDAFPFHRFFLPAMAPAAAALVAVIALAIRDAKRWRAAAAIAAIAATVAFAAATVASELLPTRTLLHEDPRSERLHVHDKAHFDAEYFAIGRWLREHAPPDALLATNAAGIIPYESGLPTLDMLGLCDAHIAHAPIALGEGTTGHEKHDAAYVLSRAPDVILLGLPTRTKTPTHGEALEARVARWFPYLPGDRDLWLSPVFRHDYVPVAVPIEGKWLTIFVRRNGKLAPLLLTPEP